MGRPTGQIQDYLRTGPQKCGGAGRGPAHRGSAGDNMAATDLEPAFLALVGLVGDRSGNLLAHVIYSTVVGTRRSDAFIEVQHIQRCRRNLPKYRSYK